MGKFTKGPWKWGIGDGFYYVAVTVGSVRELIAKVMGGNRQTDEANARLIATAPDMFEGFEEIALLSEYYSLSGGTVEDLMGQLAKIFNIAVAALELADGKGDSDD